MALVFLHGSGDSGAGIRDWLASASGGQFAKALDSVKFVYPDAPQMPYTLNGGHLQTVWFDREGMSYSAPEDKVGMARSVEQVDAEIDKLLSEGVPLNRIAVGGMSMGGCVALHVGYGAGRHSGKLAAVGALSTFLAEDSGLDAAARARAQAAPDGAQGPPLFMAHGAADPMVRPQWAMATRDRLAEIGLPAPTEVAQFPGLAHDMCGPELQQLAAFLQRHLAA